MPTVRTAELIWHRIDADDLTLDLPDADTEVLIYDADLDDTLCGCYDPAPYDGSSPGWVIATDEGPLPNPTWWAEKPYPDGD